MSYRESASIITEYYGDKGKSTKKSKELKITDGGWTKTILDADGSHEIGDYWADLVLYEHKDGRRIIIAPFYGSSYEGIPETYAKLVKDTKEFQAFMYYENGNFDEYRFKDGNLAKKREVREEWSLDKVVSELQWRGYSTALVLLHKDAVETLDDFVGEEFRDEYDKIEDEN